MVEGFDFGPFEELESKDTLVKFVEWCMDDFKGNYVCTKSYKTYISNGMSIDFYGRFLQHLEQLDIIENYYLMLRKLIIFDIFQLYPR